ncbi:MAG TPA: class I SAM-dependent methyltransferase [Euzebyales bacterium]|nr:class I SAM-dependent methyltransferase [Euzebyales bacterium]
MTRAGHAVPQPHGLDAALGGVRGAMATLDHYRTTQGTNAQGGDPAHHASPDLLIRHTVNYLLAAEVAEEVTTDGPVLDIGSGVGVFSVWLARRLGRALHLVDHDEDVLQLARRSFGDVMTHTDVADAPRAAVVTAMEVLEHVRYQDQDAFVRAMLERVVAGGVLVCSTPDERQYVGGWSGYAPHVGTLDPTSLRTLLHNACGLPVDVWRIDGPGFRLGLVQRVGEPIVNRVWGLVQARMPGLVNRVAGALGRRRRRGGDAFEPGPPDDAFTVTPAEASTGPGTGLLAVVHVPPT